MTVERKIRVMIVEDSATMRALLEHIVEGDRRLEVAASVATAEDALRALPTVKPDVISLDIRLPGMNGFEATRRIMSEHPTPIVVVSASVEASDLKISMNALSAGALAVVEKPAGGPEADHSVLAERLRRQLVIMSDVPVIRQRHGRAPASATRKQPEATRPPPALPGSFQALGIVASTGGPNAILAVLQSIDPACMPPILLVQHMTPSFLAGFVAWLDDACPHPVTIARDGDPALPGYVYVAAAERHLEFDGRRLRTTDGPAVSSQKPSGTVLLQSLALNLGSQALGVLLTGMGDDGAEGLAAIRSAGGYTIAEDASTAVVYGMPAVAARIGAVCEQLPLQRIGARLREIGQLNRAAV